MIEGQRERYYFLLSELPDEEEEDEDDPGDGEVDPELELDDEESLFEPESLLLLSADFDDSPLPPLSFLPESFPESFPPLSPLPDLA